MPFSIAADLNNCFSVNVLMISNLLSLIILFLVKVIKRVFIPTDLSFESSGVALGGV